MSDEKTPRYQVAVTLLTKIATPLFQAGMTIPEGSPASERFFESWYFVKGLAGRISSEHRIALSVDDVQGLKVSFDLLHDRAHDGDINGAAHFAVCKCATASLLIDFLEVVCEEQKAAVLARREHARRGYAA